MILPGLSELAPSWFSEGLPSLLAKAARGEEVEDSELTQRVLKLAVDLGLMTEAEEVVQEDWRGAE